MNLLFSESLDVALDACPAPLLEPLKGARLAVTGASGFFGNWVLRAIMRLNVRSFGIQAQCLARDPDRVRSRYPELTADPDITWLKASASEFSGAAVAPGLTHILHMAASSDARDYTADPMAASRVILDGATGCIELARRTGAHLHFVSSGAVYGSRRRSDGPSRESQVQRYAPDTLSAAQAYGNAKRMAESLLACGLENYSISRPFAFLGPLLPLDQHFAAGNFIADAMTGKPIVIKGDGTPLRSYMHPADLAVWLLALIASGPRREAVNVGSPDAVSILELAAQISSIARSPGPIVLGQDTSQGDPSSYWPDIDRAKGLGLRLSLGLERSVADSLAWARSQASSNSLL